MKIRMRLLFGLLVLGLLFTAGICAAAEDNSIVVNTTIGETPVADSGPGQDTGVLDDIPPYDGPVGPGSALYGLKVAIEGLDETFTFNETERIGKQLNHARLRIAEVRRELQLNRTGSADQALALYGQKLNQTQTTLTPFASNATGLLHAQEMTTKHEAVLADLLLSYPNNTGLMRAYNNSLALERKFEQKTATKFERVVEKNNRTILKAVRLELAETARAGKGEGEQVEKQEQERTEQRDMVKAQTNTTPVRQAITTQASETQKKPVVTAAPQQSRTPANNNGNTKKTDTGTANENNTGKGRNK